MFFSQLGPGGCFGLGVLTAAAHGAQNVERSRLGGKSRSTGAQSFSQLVQVLRVREGAQPQRARNPDHSAINDEIAADYCFSQGCLSGGPSQPVLVGRP